jgi:uncharacterized membrane protein YdbT with pleckstrin-like domain
MKPEDTQPQHSEPGDYSKPVAYDTEGRPLYLHPPTSSQAQSQQQNGSRPQVVHLARPLDPVAPEVSDDARARHEASKKKYPTLNLSEGEYVISAVRRHPIGLVPIFGFVGLMLLFLLGAIPFYDSFRDSSSNPGGMPSVAVVAVLALLLGVLFAVGGLIAAYVYIQNKFFLTNESVIQEIQHSLFSKHEQTVSLANIEDASYRQENIVEHLFNFGSIRLSTEGDETTYRFSYVSDPKRQIAILNNAVEAFKNGRPVADD